MARRVHQEGSRFERRRRGGVPSPGVLAPDEALRRLGRAIAARGRLLRDPTGAVRVVNGAPDGLSGLVIERLADVLIVQVHEGRCGLAPSALQRVCEHALTQLACRAAYRKVFPRDRAAAAAGLEQLHHDPQPWLGREVAAEIVVTERGLRFLVRPYDGYATGLFIEHRDNRRRVSQTARGRRVLNLFAYTCGYSLAAAAGGAADVVSVDMSRKSLEWGRRQFELNGLGGTPAAFLCADARDYLRRAARQGKRFDLVILDPPTFSRARRGSRTFSARREVGELAAAAIELLAPGGRVLLCWNDRGLEVAQVVRSLPAGRVIVRCAPALPLDFRGDPQLARSLWLEARATVAPAGVVSRAARGGAPR